MRILTPNQMKKAELLSEKLGVSRARLMENAGKILADVIHEHCASEISEKNPEEISVVFLAGSGNNGGDCFTAARFLNEKKYNITIVNLCGKPHTELSQAAFRRLDGTDVNILRAYRGRNMQSALEAAEIGFMTLPRENDLGILSDSPELPAFERLRREEKARIAHVMETIENADVLVDGVFGTGFHGTLDNEIAAFLKAGKKAYKIAADVPSGGNCASGNAAEGSFEADETVAFGALKTGMTQYPLKNICGKIRIADIGIPENAYCIDDNERKYALVDSGEISEFPKKRAGNSHKGNFGHVLCIVGSTSMRGAAALSVLGALRSGAGLVTAATVEKTADAAVVLAPEAMFCVLDSDDYGYMLYDYNIAILEKEMEKADAILIGCGIGVTADTAALTKFVIENANCPIIIDADGINCIAPDIDILLKKKTDIILTPHPGEMARLSGITAAEVNADRFSAAENFALKYGVTVVLKGAGTVIAGSECTYVNSTGNPGMSRGGSGDVLAGITASLTAQGYGAFNAAYLAAYLHGLAGDIAAEKLGFEAMLPRDIIDALSDSFRKIKNDRK